MLKNSASEKKQKCLYYPERGPNLDTDFSFPLRGPLSQPNRLKMTNVSWEGSYAQVEELYIEELQNILILFPYYLPHTKHANLSQRTPGCKGSPLVRLYGGLVVYQPKPKSFYCIRVGLWEARAQNVYNEPCSRRIK